MAASVSAVRAPELRAQILDGSFQIHRCSCGGSVRFETELSYQDLERKQWIVHHPYPKLAEWGQLEDQAQRLFDLAFGEAASRTAQELGQGISPRVVFGGTALREKLLARELELDDVTLECVKLALMKREQLIPKTGEELRFAGLREGALEIAHMAPARMQILGVYGVGRGFYDEVAADTAAWSRMREQLEGGPFVDAQRLYLDAL
jgi:hypothetical protein